MGDNTPGKLVTPMMRLQDPLQTKIMIVTLPETTPVVEAAHLQNDLQRAGIEPWGWIINSSLAAAKTLQPLLQKRALSEREQIAIVRDKLSRRYAVVAMQAEEPVGVEKLKSLCETANNSAAA
jgi:arsenite-transporting ATPase